VVVNHGDTENTEGAQRRDFSGKPLGGFLPHDLRGLLVFAQTLK